MKNVFTYLMVVVCMVATATSAIAQAYSYVYIQGDKQTPFYVRMDGKMLPRYAKNYTIIPKLRGGNINIEVLFQQNVYPAQTFTIQVPEHSYRGLLLSRQADSFALYDLDSKTYLTK